MQPEAQNDIPALVRRLQTEGDAVSELTDWPSQALAAILLVSKSGALYLIEPVPAEPSLITRIAEAPPFYGEYRLPAHEAIVRRPGNPDRDLALDRCVNILGLSRKNTQFDPDSIYTTTPLVEIKYLAIDS